MTQQVNRGDGVAAAEGRQSLALLYHELRPEEAAYSYVLSCRRFAEHLAALNDVDEAAGRYQPVLTFDDGHSSNYEYALPMLVEHGRSAHFFITAGWTGSRTGYMNATQLRALHGAGQQIGAHGWSHTLLTRCDAAQLRRELVDTKAFLEDALSAPVTSLSLPGGRANAAVLRACREAGYTTVWTSVPRAEALPLGPTVGRYNILGSANAEFLGRLLDPRSGVLRAAERKHRLKSSLQQLLGDRLYARLWSALNREETSEAAETASAQPVGEPAP